VGHYAVTAVGVDRPGIVAAVTGVLADQGWNLEDTSMSVLRGHFAMVMVVSAPDNADADATEWALAENATELGLVVTVRAVEDMARAADDGQPWTISVYGADRPGIVSAVTTLLAGAGANITDLTTRVIGDDDRPVYAMLLEVSLPAGVDGDEVAAGLQVLAAELGVDCTAKPVDVDIL